MKNRALLETLPGGTFLIQALQDLEDQMHAQPFRIGGVDIYSGLGSPQGVIVAVVGSLYLRTDGSTSTTLYVKTSGTSNTGWTAK